MLEALLQQLDTQCAGAFAVADALLPALVEAIEGGAGTGDMRVLLLRLLVDTSLPLLEQVPSVDSGWHQAWFCTKAVPCAGAAAMPLQLAS